MEKTSIYEFYKLGLLLNEFNPNEETTNVELYNRITNFFDYVQKLNLQVTNAAITLGKIRKYHKHLDTKNKKEKAKSDLIKKVNTEINKLIPTFEAEILNKNSFVLKDKKFKTEHLIDNQTLLFRKEEVLLSAPFDVKYNVLESANCLAFDRNTACALHILLATEQYVKYFNNKFYESIEDTEEEINFFNLLKETEEILSELKHNSELISLLHIIRKHYRNQSQHSNRKFTEIEATDLFNICIKIMNELYGIIEENVAQHR